MALSINISKLTLINVFSTIHESFVDTVVHKIPKVVTQYSQRCSTVVPRRDWQKQKQPENRVFIELSNYVLNAE